MRGLQLAVFIGCLLVVAVLGARMKAGAPAATTEVIDGQVVETPGVRSGFWTSSRPAEGGAYRYRMLGVGLGVLALTGGIAVHLIRKHRATGVNSLSH